MAESIPAQTDFVHTSDYLFTYIILHSIGHDFLLIKGLHNQLQIGLQFKPHCGMTSRPHEANQISPLS